MKKRVVEVNDDAAVDEDSSGSSDGDDCFKIVPSHQESYYEQHHVLIRKCLWMNE